MADEATATAEKQIVNVPITKGKTTLAVTIDNIPADVWAEVILQGLKVLLNRGTSKVTKETYPKAEELAAKAVEVANEQLTMVMTSKIKFTGGKKKSGATGAVMTEARRLAKALVKDELKRAGIKISHVEASEITKAANAYLETAKGAELVEQAKINLADREKVHLGDTLNIASMVAISPELVAKAEAKKAKGGTLSAKQAGMVKSKSKPAQATAH
jgi:uncharacterized protein with PIN domain